MRLLSSKNGFCVKNVLYNYNTMALKCLDSDFTTHSLPKLITLEFLYMQISNCLQMIGERIIEGWKYHFYSLENKSTGGNSRVTCLYHLQTLKSSSWRRASKCSQKLHFSSFQLIFSDSY